MDWDAQAQNYWKDKPSAQAKKAQNNSKRNLIIAAVVAVLALCGAVSVWRGRSARKRALAAAEEEKKAKKKVVNLAPITLSSIKQAHTDACLAEAGERDMRWAYLQCRQRCIPMRDIMPKPTMWRSCLSGCEQGANAALQLGCTTITNVPHCENEVKKQCKSQSGGFCSNLVNEEPKPALFEMCSMNCQGELLTACDRAIVSLGNHRKQEL